MLRPARVARSRPIASLALAGLLVFAPELALATTDSILATKANAGDAAFAGAVAADPFPPLTDATARKASSVVTPESVGGPSYTRAYVALGAGAALLLGSFLLAESADRQAEAVLPFHLPDDLVNAFAGAGNVISEKLAGTTVPGRALLIAGHVEGDAEDPRLQVANVAQTRLRPPAFQEGFLRGIVGVIPVAEQVEEGLEVGAGGDVIGAEIDVTGLVIEDEQRAVLRAIDPIDDPV